MNKFIVAGVASGVFLLLMIGLSLLPGQTGNPTPELPGEIVAQNGLHWHATLKIIANGELIKIPANIGLGVVHNPIHTHDDEPGLIHMEFGGMVTSEDLMLGKFFKVWGRPFESEGSTTMTVNGKPNDELERYMMRDGDIIEITYQ